MANLVSSISPLRDVARAQGAEPSRDLCQSVYLPPEAETGWTFESLLGRAEYRFFSYGRRALAEAFRIAGVGQGDNVALPALICREILSAVHASGASPRFYRVGDGLGFDGPAGRLESCKAVIAVNYFGFPQDLAPFLAHCRRTGAVLIEDNAHGLFSRDAAGTLLGTRGDVGIFSLRKTLPLPDGAALVVNAVGRTLPLAPQQPFESGPMPLRYRLKQCTRRVAPLVGCRTLHRLLMRTRRLPGGAESRSATSRDRVEERTLPNPARPCDALSRPLTADIGRETARRRALYEWLDGWLRDVAPGIRPVFPGLPEQVVPYAYPFYADGAELSPVRRLLGEQGLDCVTWPDLPEAVRAEAPNHYTTLRMVPFLW